MKNWNDYFMDMAEVVATKSKDPSTQVGCVIVDKKHRPVSNGYNGFVSGCDEKKMSQERPLKYHLVIHAEMNALIFSNKSLEGCIVYTTHYPCDNCLKHLLQAGVRQIYYKYDEHVERYSKEQKEAIKRFYEAVPDMKLTRLFDA